MGRIRVAVPVPALEALTYSVPDSLPTPAIGARVLVPLGNRVITGVVVCDSAAESGEGSRTDDEGVKPLAGLLDSDAFLPRDVVDLAAWVAEYYACGIGEAIAAAMPPLAWLEAERRARITEAGQGRMLLERGARRDLLERLHAGKDVPVGTLLANRRAAQTALAALEREGLVDVTRTMAGDRAPFRTVTVARITAQGLDMAEPDTGHAAGTGPVRLTTRQRDVLTLLAAAPDGLDTAALKRRNLDAARLKRLAALGLVSLSRRRVERDPAGHAVSAVTEGQPARVALTPEQNAALARLRELAQSRRFATAVVHGVTGSGKTEIYLRLAEEVARSGRGVLVLVPEIALTPAVAGAFRRLFGDRVAIQHSGLSDGERHDQWHRIHRGEVQVVVGTRSAVFAPLRNPGLIVVDEEHDGSYKQEESPRYHGRDVAVKRAQRSGALAVLGSATPSLESYANAQNGRYVLLSLQKRVLDRPMASVRLVDMRHEYAAHGPDVVISAPLAAAIGERLGLGEQAIVLLNRRGFATSLFCRQCGATLDCPNCSVTLTIHRAARRARCHYCNYSIGAPVACVQCAGPYLEHVGFGTERVEAEIAALFPRARVTRVDRDTIRRKGAIARLLERFASGAIDVLVGTQMIAKGHDFPKVTLVGVVSADVGLGLADFRAGERTFQLLTQVAGRAGRGEIVGEAIIQTIHPGHYSIRHACRQDYDAFYQDEIRFRHSMRYPPAVAMINAIVRSRSLDAALADAGTIVHALRWGGQPYRVLGPAPAPLSKLKGEHRAQLFIKGTHRAAMRKALLTALDGRPDIKRRTIVDIDPMSVL